MPRDNAMRGAGPTWTAVTCYSRQSTVRLSGGLRSANRGRLIPGSALDLDTGKVPARRQTAAKRIRYGILLRLIFEHGLPPPDGDPDPQGTAGRFRGRNLRPKLSGHQT